MAYISFTVVASMLMGGAIVIEVQRRFSGDDTRVTELSTVVSQQMEKILVLSTDLERMEKTVQNGLVISNQRAVEVLQTVNVTINSSMADSIQWIFNNTNDTMKANLEWILNVMNNSLHNNEDTLIDQIKLLNNSWQKHHQQSYQRKMNSFIERYIGLNNQIQAVEMKLDNSKKELKQDLDVILTSSNLTCNACLIIEEKYRQLHHKFYTMKTEQEFANANFTHLDTFQLTVIAMALVEAFCMVVLCSKLQSVSRVSGNYWRTASPDERDHNGQNYSVKDQRLSSENHVNGMIEPRNLQNSVCVLSFYGGKTHDDHLTVSKSFLDPEIRVEDFVIDRHEDIKKVPHSKIMLVHVHYNGRNIILEDPKREIGDLKRVAVLSLQKMGAAVFIFYYEEKTGRSLVNENLYNPQLESVKIHTVLKQLEAQQRVISLRQGATLTEHQQRHLKSAVSDILK